LIAEIILFIIFFIFAILGFFIIYKQVNLVKKGEFSLKDGLLCVFYGIVFSMALMIVMVMAFIFAIKSPELWELSTIKPQEDINPLMLSIPIALCLGYISIYPLIDFIFIAMSSKSHEGLTIFHKILGKNIIARFNSKILSVFIAISLYIGVFIIPPIIISFLGVPLIIVWITWFLIYPMMILTYFGAKGYIAGITNSFFHLPDLNRSLFLGFEDSKRSLNEFANDPLPRILIGFMLFVFVWQWVSMIQTLNFLFTGSLAISTYSYSGMVFITLLFGVIGYFTRFWGRKIKYRGIDIYFAAYLMAAVGINIFVNFLIVNIKKLTETLNAWVLTKPIPIPINFPLFAIPAVIEEIFIVIFILYYFINKKNSFSINLYHSKITECGQKFDPIPLFNFIKSSDLKIQKYAEQTLINMYERIPLKKEYDINKVKYKNPLFDGICDPDAKTRRICYRIFTQLLKDSPNSIAIWIKEALYSPNYDKSIPIARSLLEVDIKHLQKLQLSIFFDLINDPEWRMREISLKIISRLIEYNKDLIQELNIQELLNNPDSNIQIELIKLLSKSSTTIPTEILIKKIGHNNKNIRATAIKHIKLITKDNLKSELISKVLPLMTDPSSSVRASLYELLAEFKDFYKLPISLTSLLDGLIDPDEKVRNASILLLGKYIEEKPKAIELNQIINRIDERDPNRLLSILILLGKIWDKNPEKIIEILSNFINYDNIKIKEKISDIFVEKYQSNPDLIFNNLIKIPEISKFLTKGIISRTLIRIAKKYPKDIIPKLNKIIKVETEDICLNAISTLEGLATEFPELIDVEPLIIILKKPWDVKLKNEIINLFTNIAKIEPKLIKSIMPELFEIFNQQEITVKITLVKSLSEIVEKTPKFIQIDSIDNLLNDKDSFIRESATKILGRIGENIDDYKKSIEYLLNKTLIDKDWIVRQAAITSLGNIIHKIEDKDFIIEKLIPLLDDNESWVRRSVLNLLSDIKDINVSKIPFQKILDNINHKDENVREATVGLLKIFAQDNIEKVFDEIISLLDDPSKDVRNRIINVMVELIKRKGLKNLLPSLLKHLSDEFSIELQRSIALILGRTINVEDDDTKNRVISLLKMRCEMSQDQIICKVFHQLNES